MDDSFVVFTQHREFKQLIAILRNEPFKLSKVNFEIPYKWSFSPDVKGESVRALRKTVLREFGVFVNQIREQIESDDDSRMRLLMATKAVLTAADTAASGLRRNDKSIEEWVEDSLKTGSSKYSIGQMIKKRITAVERSKRKTNPAYKFTFHKFQKGARNLSERAVLLSSCGSGKTLAAYLWIRKQLVSRKNRKVVFLYPTTNTAAQGFRDYASYDKDAVLVSSRAEFDLEGMFTNPDDDERSGFNYLPDQQLYALGYWPKHIFNSTVDAFLGFTQNNYTSLCLLPVLARSVVVIDEVHSFDPAMFSALLEFLEKFNVPVLLMTATLQKQRLEAICKTCPDIQIYPRKGDIKKLSDLRKANKFKRYRVSYRDDQWWNSKEDCYPKDLLAEARKAYEAGRKVLWVVNSVDRCIRIAQALKNEAAFCYHSRFMYEDRVAIHNKVVEMFLRENDNGVIAVTTQVCEMSLDMDADLLITEWRQPRP